MFAGVWCKVHSRPSDELVLGQRRRRLSGIEQAMGCNAGPTLKRNWVGGPTSLYMCRDMRQHDSLAMLASTGDGGGRNSLHVEDIF